MMNASIQRVITVPSQDPRARARATYDVERYRALPERLRMLRDECLVLLDGRAAETPGGLTLPSMLQDIPTTGTVLTCGPRCTSVEPGERVVFGKANGERVDDSTARRIGYEPGQLYIMRAIYVPRVGEREFIHVAQDHIQAVMEDE